MVDRLDKLKYQYKSFMKRAIKLDPNMVTTPGRKHAYITKTKLEEIKQVQLYHSTSLNFV